MAKLNLDELKRLEQAATPGQWQTEGGMNLYVFDDRGAMVAEMRGTGAGLSEEQQASNAHFIAAARNELPKLLRIAEAAKRLGPAICMGKPEEVRRFTLELSEALRELEE